VKIAFASNKAVARMKSSTHTWKTVIIDGAQIIDEESFHREFKFKFGFLGDYWMDFDSFYDRLSSLSTEGISKHFKIAQNEELVIRIQNSEKFINCDTQLFAKFIRAIIEVNLFYERSRNYTRILLELI
jgi:RNAse (barnase) inhibitor barstar